MKTHATLVRTNGIVVLNTITHIGLHTPLVIDPIDAKRHYAVGNAKPLYQINSLKFRVLIVHVLYRRQHLVHRLNVFRLVRKTTLQFVYHCLGCHTFIFFCKSTRKTVMLYHFPPFFFNRHKKTHKNRQKSSKIVISFHYIHFYYYFCTIFSNEHEHADNNYQKSVRQICI